ncbi:MAG TPA: molybdopterin-binding protein [Planctomycetota bacterium]|nr:molybdopterin-binding protein [Planctomycetota bacterium]
MASTKTAWIFSVGRDLLEGLVLDRNANFIATRVSELGIKVRSFQTVDGVKEEMVAALEAALATKPTYVFCAGGMGPSHDDVTREAVAEVLGVPLEKNPEAVEMVGMAFRRLLAKGGTTSAEMTETRQRIAYLPKGAKPYENPVGTGPACVVSGHGTTFILLPGVPEELQRIFSLHIIPLLRAEGITTHRKTRTIEYAGHDETAISAVLADHGKRFPGVSSRTIRYGTEESTSIRIKLFGEHTDPRALDDLLERAEADLRARLGVEIARGSGEADAGRS